MAAPARRLRSATANSSTSMIVIAVLLPSAAALCFARSPPTRVPSPRMSATHEPSESEKLEALYPTRALTPVRVCEIQLRALQLNNPRMVWRFSSPEAKRETGILRPSRYAYLVPPRYSEIPLFAPLVGALDFKIVGALSVSDCLYKCRVRVWPAGGEREQAGEAMPAAPEHYIWRLALQPEVRPSCYEDDPLQQGISAGPPFGGCWLVDEVRRDDRWGRGNEDRPLIPAGGGGAAKRQPRPTRPARERALAIR